MTRSALRSVKLGSIKRCKARISLRMPPRFCGRFRWVRWGVWIEEDGGVAGTLTVVDAGERDFVSGRDDDEAAIKVDVRDRDLTRVVVLREGVGFAVDRLGALVRAEDICGNVSTGSELVLANSKLQTDIISTLRYLTFFSGL